MKTILLDKKSIHSGSLILINGEHGIMQDKDGAEMRLVPFKAANGDIFLEATAAALLSQLLQTLSTGDRIIPVSGYRSHDEQAVLYDSSLSQNGGDFTARYVARPGQSEHQTGLAVDMAVNTEHINPICPDFPDTVYSGEFHNNAYRFGFIERYGQNKQSITGIAHEPWHYRYVGYPHSRIIRENCLCLEEYISVIRDFQYGSNPLRIRQNNKLIEISYLAADDNNTVMKMKDDDVYQVSGNNIDGFIVTLWRNMP
jgi:D-alanyl-D-alanine dipeptidase/carboxypeptidase